MSDSAKGRGRGARPPSRPKVATPDPCPDDDYDEHARWAAKAWPTIDLAVEAIVSRIDTAQRHLERSAVDSRDQVGLAHGELKILLRLARGTRNQGELAKSLLVSTGTMTNQLDKLEAAGLATRLPDPDDRRGKLVEMTPKGRQTLDAYINLQAHREREALDRLSPADKQQLNDLLRKLLASLHAKRAP